LQRSLSEYHINPLHIERQDQHLRSIRTTPTSLLLFHNHLFRTGGDLIFQLEANRANTDGPFAERSECIADMHGRMEASLLCTDFEQMREHGEVDVELRRLLVWRPIESPARPARLA
jgi:hypothetical protein